MDILLDTNIWRYIVDVGSVSRLRKAAGKSSHRIAIAPGVVYEALRTEDRALRAKMVASMASPAWHRLMPEAYSEAMELRDEIVQLRPKWLRQPAELMLLNRLRFDWRRSRGGFWDRVVHAMDREAAAVANSSLFALARREAEAMREDAKQFPRGERDMPLDGLVAQLETPLPGSRGGPVDYWRICSLYSWMASLRVENHAYDQWLSGEVITAHLTIPSADLTQFWFYDAQAERMPRQWLRAAISHLQRFQRVTNGTPADQQIATYLPDVDLFLSADRNLVRIANECRNAAPFPLATASLVARADAVDAVLTALAQPRATVN